MKSTFAFGSILGTGLLLGLALSPSAFALTAKIEYVSGPVKLWTEQVSRPAAVGSAVSEKDTIATGEGALAILSLSDGSKFKISERTQLTLYGLLDDGENPAHKTDFFLHKGSFFSQVAKQKERRRFQVRTKSAVMGVRGTEFFAAYGKKAKQFNDTWLCVHEGSVEIESIEEQKPVLVKAGLGVSLPEGKSITEPKMLPWTKNLNWNMDPAKGDLVDTAWDK